MMQSNKVIIKLVVMLIPVLSELVETLPWYLDSALAPRLNIKAGFQLVLIKQVSNDTSLDNLYYHPSFG